MVISVKHLLDQTGRPLGGSLQHQMWPAWALSPHHSCNMFLRLTADRRAWQKSCTSFRRTGYTTGRPTCASATSDMLIQRETTKQPLARSSWQHLPGSPRGYRCRLCLEVDFATRGHLAEHLVRATCNTMLTLQHITANSSEKTFTPIPAGGTEAWACRAARCMPVLWGDLPGQRKATGACQAQLHRAGKGLHPQRPGQAHSAGGVRPGPLLRTALPGVRAICLGKRRCLG